MSRSGGSMGSAGHGNVLRTPFGQRDEDKERVNVLTILSNLESIVVNLDNLNQKISGLTLHVRALLSLSLSLSLLSNTSCLVPAHDLSPSMNLVLKTALPVCAGQNHIWVRPRPPVLG
jgi:hypothetical protein